MNDKPLKLATCVRCEAYVLHGQVSGLRVAVDPAPAALEAVREALLADRSVYRLLRQAGRPWKLQDLHRGSTLAGEELLVEHGCPSRSARPKAFQEVETPPVASASNGSGRDGLHRPPVHADAALMSSHVRRVSPRPSNPNVDHSKAWLYRVCAVCGEQMGYEEAFGVKIGDMWCVVWHDPCPMKEDESA